MWYLFVKNESLDNYDFFILKKRAKPMTKKRNNLFTEMPIPTEILLLSTWKFDRGEGKNWEFLREFTFYHIY